jgi:two-component system, chemotaxis family, chemotaxis protein CheY
MMAGKKTVLVADDSATMRRMIMAALAGSGHAFEQAESGLGAIERVTLAQVDLVILDLNMPDVHGLEVLKFIRGHDALRDLPVIVLTTRGDPQSRAAALEAGATLYMTKPFQPQAIAAEVERLVRAA